MPFARFTRRLRPSCPNLRAVFLSVVPLAACGWIALLAGCGSGSSTSLPVSTLPVTSGTRLLFDTSGIADNAFASGIDTIAPDGSNFQRVVNDDSAAMPRFSADGNKLVYEAGSGISFLVISNADGSHATQTPSPSAPSLYPAFRPDGKAIVFVSGSDALYMQNIDGSQVRKIYTSPTGYGAFRPVYTPDGTHIVFEQDPNPATSDTPKVYSINADGSNRRLIGSDFSVTPAVSPNGKRIAYGAHVNGGSVQGLFVTNSDGTGQPTLLISSPASNPVFSPDGTKIAYLKLLNSNAFINGSPTYEIHVLNIDGTGDRRVGTKLAVGTNSLDWR